MKLTKDRDGWTLQRPGAWWYLGRVVSRNEITFARMDSWRGGFCFSACMNGLGLLAAVRWGRV